MEYEAPKAPPRRSTKMPQAPDTSIDSDPFNVAQPKKRGPCDESLLPVKKIRTGQDPAAGLLDNNTKPPTRRQLATGLPLVPEDKLHFDTVKPDRAGSAGANLSTERVKHTGKAPKTPDNRYTSFTDLEIKRETSVSLSSTHIENKNAEFQPRPAPLTRQNLALFTNMANSTKTNQLCSSTTGSRKTISTKTISTAAAGFLQRCLDNGILMPDAADCPTNAVALRDMYNKTTETPLPTKEEFDEYCFRARSAPNEATVVVEFSKRVLKEVREPGYRAVFNQQFGNFPKDVGFNDGISPPQPDFVEALEVYQFQTQEIRHLIPAAALTKHTAKSLILPQIAGELKGRSKSLDLARHQSAYDGAALVYARNQALAYLREPDHVGHAKILTFVTDGQHLEIYAHYAVESKFGELQYHQYEMDRIDILLSHNNFRTGLRWVWNLQENARAQSCAIRDMFVAQWAQAKGYPLPSGLAGSHKLATTPDLADHGGATPVDNVAAQARHPEAAAVAPGTNGELQSLPSTNNDDTPSVDTPSASAQKRKAAFSSRETSPGCPGRKR